MMDKVKFLLLLVRVKEGQGRSSESVQVLEQARDMQARYSPHCNLHTCMFIIIASYHEPFHIIMVVCTNVNIDMDKYMYVYVCILQSPEESQHG